MVAASGILAGGFEIGILFTLTGCGLYAPSPTLAAAGVGDLQPAGNNGCGLYLQPAGNHHALRPCWTCLFPE